MPMGCWVFVSVGCDSPNNFSMSLHALPLSESVLISIVPAGLDFTGRTLCRIVRWDGPNAIAAADTAVSWTYTVRDLSNIFISSEQVTTILWVNSQNTFRFSVILTAHAGRYT